MISELDTVVLTRDLPENGLEAGDVGTVVLIHDEGAGYEVEFTSLAGNTLAVVNGPRQRYSGQLVAGKSRTYVKSREIQGDRSL
jgi:hypothetical protein